MIAGTVITLVIFVKFSDAPWLGERGILEQIFTKPTRGTWGYDIWRISEGIGISFVASIIFYIINGILPRYKRERIYEKESKIYLKKLLSDMKKPFEDMARFYVGYPLKEFDFMEVDLNNADTLESDVFEGINKLGPYVKNGKHRKTLEYIYDYICKVDEDIDKILSYEEYLEVSFLDTIRRVQKTEYYKQYKRLYEEPSYSNSISPDEGREIIAEQYRFCIDKRPMAIQEISIYNINTNTLKKWIEIYRSLAKYTNKKTIIMDA